MRHTKRALRTIAMCLVAALSFLAFATAAEAESNWRIEGKNLTKTTELGLEKDVGPYSFLVPSLNFALVFENVTIDKGSLFTAGTSSGTLLFTEGKLYTIKPFEWDKACTVGNLEFKFKGHLFLHEGKTYTQIEPQEGTTFTVTTYGGAECPLPKEVTVSGSMVLEDSKFETEAVQHLIQQGSSALFPSQQMLFGTHPMNLDGSMWLTLLGASKGLKWSGLT